MPFEIPQQEPVIKTRFAEFADAMLRGCAVTKPCRHALVNCAGETCAMGAMLVGFGNDPKFVFHAWQDGGIEHIWASLPPGQGDMVLAYEEKYGQNIPFDNDSGEFTREQIAARIAALR